MPEPNKRLAQMLKEGRAAKALTLRQLAAEIGVTHFTVSKVENGHIAPGEDYLVASAKALDLDLDNLLAVAGRIAPDVREAIVRTPALAGIIRASAKTAETA